MKNLNEKYIKLLRDNHKALQNDEEASMILDAISKVIPPEEGLIHFIKEELCIYRNKKDAFTWYYDVNLEGVIDIGDVEIEIDDTMLNKTLMDILLEHRYDYKKVSDDLYIAYDC